MALKSVESRGNSRIEECIYPVLLLHFPNSLDAVCSRNNPCCQYGETALLHSDRYNRTVSTYRRDTR